VHDIVTELVVRHDWIIGVVFLAGLMMLLPMFEAKSLRARILSVIVVGSLWFVFWGMLGLRESEHGRWIALQPDSPTSQYVGFLKAFPRSKYADPVRVVVRSRQRTHMKSPTTPVARSILEALSAQEAIPPTMELRINGDRQYSSSPDRAKVERYDAALKEFGQVLGEQLQALVLPVGGEVHVNDGDVAPDATAFVVAYEADLGSRYVQNPSGYSFNAMGLSAEWSLFIAGSNEPAHSGTIALAHPPAEPSWKGSKLPEEVVADIVVETVLGEFAGVLGVDPPDLSARQRQSR
jgi:hypothetical protein